MALRNRAYLELTRGNDTAVFEFSDGLEETSTVSKNYLVSGRGQYLREIWDQVNNFDPENAAADEVPVRRAGYHLDGGAGEKSRQLAFETGNEPDGIRWGDGAGGDGPSNVTATDASGADVNKHDRLDVFRYWVAESRTDSTNPGWLYYNMWADGTYGDSPGQHGTPMPVIIREATAKTDTQEASSISGTITLVQANEFADAAENLLDKSQDALDEVRDFA